ncbi:MULTISPECIES: hypothetical protein [unclassified Flavobacterium]|uniref:hypothetical protein n=1 Tax=unclassified Flavobacterium TaxID=196869 RepID=UPI001F12B056|nr:MULTISPECIES: hypothetical protein [unclassified Flavobacterium]UMY65046.1 hypothetical protein MKO97_11040 [Flavobacterium sp. HJ-32-4]
MEETVHLIFTYPESYPEEIINNDISEIKENELKVHITKQGNAMYNALEWIVPTFLATYILKPYFEAFLQEAGKDHYQLVKSACKKMLARGKSTQAHLIAAEESTQKLSGKYNESLAVSILFQTAANRQIKMLFNNSLSLKEWENAVDEFSEIMLEHYRNFPNDILSNEIKDLSQKPYYSIYVKINPETKKLEFHDDNTLISEVKNLNRS